MNKYIYLEDLKNLLKEHNVYSADMREVIRDYEELYDQFLIKGYTDEQVWKQLGTPTSVYHALKNDLRYDQKQNDKVIALMPFISLIIFMIVGLSYNIWHPTWLIFLLTPLSAILLNTKIENSFVGIGCFIALIAYVLWLYFMPSYWRYHWLVFMLVPFLGYLYTKKRIDKILGTLSILVFVALYIILIQNGISVGYALIGFAIPTVYAIWAGYLKIELNVSVLRSKIYVTLLLITLLSYFLVSMIWGHWGYTWVILLLIPCVFIHSTEGFKHMITYLPFLAVIAFMSVGYWLNYWQYAWMIFLVIPIYAILDTKNHKIVTIDESDDSDDIE